jgi:hypothetical protein
MNHNLKKESVSKNKEQIVKNFQETVVAWSKLASIGARPMAEFVGIDRDFYARVLNKRRELPQENAESLGGALGIRHDGFVPMRIQSHLCRHLEDLAAIEELGFEAHYIAHIKTSKEVKGGQSLQKYILVNFSQSGVGRLSILRMATAKWHRLIEQLNFPDLPIIEIETPLISELNAIDEPVEVVLWSQLQSAIQAKENLVIADQMQKLLLQLINKKIDQVGMGSDAKRIDRKTDLLRLAEVHTTMSDWPAAAVHYAQSHVIVPLTQEFSPANAAGIRNDEERVFVYVTTLGDTQCLTLERDIQSKVDQVLIFYANPLKPKSTYEVLFDGRFVYLLAAAKRHNLLQDKKITLTARDLHFMEKDPDPGYALKRRKNRGHSRT